jgi:hypothetical protein
MVQNFSFFQGKNKNREILNGKFCTSEDSRYTVDAEKLLLMM